MNNNNFKVRVAKTVALEKIKKHYEKAMGKSVSTEEIADLMNTKKISKEIYDYSIAELIEEKQLLPEDVQIEGTIILQIPSYLSKKASRATLNPEDSNKNPEKQNISNEDFQENSFTDNLGLFNTPKSEQPQNKSISNYPENKLKEQEELFWEHIRSKTQNLEEVFKTPQNRNINKIPQIQQNAPGFVPPRLNRNIATLEARHAVMMIPEFDGSIAKKVFEFVEKVDNVYRVVDPNQVELLNVLIRNKISNGAEQLIRNQRPDNWEELKRILLDHYATKKSVNKRIGDLITCKQGSDTVTEFASNLQQIYSGIRHAAREDNLDPRWVQTLLLKIFLDGLQRDIAIIVRAQRPLQFQEALHLAIETEAEISPSKSKEMYCSFCKKNTHNTRDCRTAHRANRAFNISDSEETQSFSKPQFNNNGKLKSNPQANFQNNFQNNPQNQFNRNRSPKNNTNGFPKDYWNYGYNYNPHYWTPIPNQVRPEFVHQVRRPWNNTWYDQRNKTWKPQARQSSSHDNNNNNDSNENSQSRSNSPNPWNRNNSNWKPSGDGDGNDKGSRNNYGNHNRNNSPSKNNNSKNTNRVNLNQVRALTPTVVMGRML